ncbi:hypothetical protein AB9F41_36380, partial [Rhizobium leguminosarum]|uniref:hypothetical protein n=1 Tax=Rhizobium leguminosarum TaxID=384 RepID=UPI003F986112
HPPGLTTLLFNFYPRLNSQNITPPYLRLPKKPNPLPKPPTTSAALKPPNTTSPPSATPNTLLLAFRTQAMHRASYKDLDIAS